MSEIEWTDKSWNPVVGCSKVSDGCKHCYALSMAHRNASNPKTPHYHGTTERRSGKTVWTGKIGVAPDRIWEEPLRRKKPTTWFVNSMGDLFHPNVPDALIDRVFAVMALCPQHRFQVLTKHPERMREWFSERWQASRFDQGTGRDTRVREVIEEMINPIFGGWADRYADTENNDHWTDEGQCIALQFDWPLSNVWLGVSVEDQARADERIPILLDTPASVRFVSCEPLLGPVDLCAVATSKRLEALQGYDNDGEDYTFNALSSDDFYSLIGANGEIVDTVDGEYRSALDWVIVGGESGPAARPMHPDWARELRDQCSTAGVPFFFKQWGAWTPDIHMGRHTCLVHPDGLVCDEHPHRPDWPDAQAQMFQVGKAKSGRLLDGVTYDGMPT